MTVRVQAADFDLTQAVAELHGGDARVGAIVTFVGTVRDRDDVGSVVSIASASLFEPR